jgi:hypothetical protein
MLGGKLLCVPYEEIEMFPEGICTPSFHFLSCGMTDSNLCIPVQLVSKWIIVPSITRAILLQIMVNIFGWCRIIIIVEVVRQYIQKEMSDYSRNRHSAVISKRWRVIIYSLMFTAIFQFAVLVLLEATL